MEEIEEVSVLSPMNHRLIKIEILKRLIIKSFIIPILFNSLKVEYENGMEKIAPNRILNNRATKGGS
jgi:hypothetical protein